MSDDLSAMVQSALDAGTTYRQLERSAIDPVTGKHASKDLFHGLVAGRVDRVPYDYHLRAIAAALGKPYDVVRDAAVAQFLSAQDEPDEPVDEFEATLRTVASVLPAAERAAVIADYRRRLAEERAAASPERLNAHRRRSSG